jgi:AraC family transcriptional regulator
MREGKFQGLKMNASVMTDSYRPFFGRSVQNLELAALLLSETRYPPHLKMPVHSHEPTYISFVLRGAYAERYGRRLRTCKASTLIIHPSAEHHAVEFHNAGAHIFRIEIKSQWLERVREYSTVLDRPADFNGSRASWLMARLYHEFRERDGVSPLAIEGLVLEMLAEVARPSSRLSTGRPPRWLERAREYLDTNFVKNTSLQSIAELVGVHPVYLAREFRSHYHLTIGDYVRQLRIQSARHQISESDASFIEIASAVGFCDQSHFTRTFKRLTGMTPTQYRATLRSS